MRWLHQLQMRFLMLFGRAGAGSHLEDELSFHLERQIQENVAAGMTREEARYSALRTFGNPALLREQTRSTWSWSSLESILRDVRIGCRTLYRAPGFALIAVFVMALGLGANVALFTIVRGVLLKPLPYVDPNHLIMLYESEHGPSARAQYAPVDPRSFFDWQKSATGVEQMAMVSPFQSYNVSAEGGKLPERIDAGWCSWNFFSILGVQPAIGRNFAASDDQPGAAASVLLTNTFWKRRYAGDPSIVGKTVWLDAHPYTVLGVLPSWFVYSGSFGGKNIQVWTPFNHEAPPSLLATYEDHEALVAARIKPGSTLQSVVAQINTIQQQIKKEHAGPAVHPFASGRLMLDDAVQDYKTPLYVLLAATVCVLFIASMNVAGLLVARTAARGKEIAIRTALGGGRLRLVREQLTESVLICVTAGAIGIAFAWTALQFIAHFQPDMNRIESVRIDGVVLLFTFVAIAVCALFSGALSAFSLESRQLLSALQESSRSTKGSKRRATLRRSLLVIEVSLTVVLLAGAGLLLKSYQRMRGTDLGIPIKNTLTMHLSLPEARYKEPAKQAAFFEQLITQVRALPGVGSAGLVSTAPGQGWGGDSLADIVERPLRPENFLDMHMRAADPGYFAAAEIPLMRGRIFTSDERFARGKVAVISHQAALQLFPKEDPIGKHLRFDFSHQELEIIGVVADTRWDIHEDPKPTIYQPLFGSDFAGATIFVRSAHNVESLAMPIESIIGHLDRDLPVSNVKTLRETIDKSTIDSQFDSLLVLAFAVIALILAAAGLYGVLSYLVTQRTSELGIRMALGAKRSQLLRAVLFDGLRPALLGLVVGFGASAFAVRLIKSMLYQTEALDPTVFTAVLALLLTVAILACLFPAWRASRLDPMQALRTE
ncbi:ABC transporter permease [Telmatobacter sp. DSM 110680]|uniref:ABC transporter permease n=1 Tax=Telmatobacter sp. DSM 110680 TaxID=3036704 RepID=A0AAU7DLP0_9BACT